ncbi:MAG TPA: Spy/CpxP family protein refolding chaperone [Pyrinomonadaceae bacterium]|nr:Spy/CpxP family protein refolding chaperone [Pyrinomonadaceae bacterium]
MKKIFAAAAVAVVLAAAGAIYTVHASGAEAARWEHAVFAQDDKDGGHFKHRVVGRVMAHVARELKLTEAQQTEIRAVFAAERQNVLPLLQRLHEARQQYDSVNAPGGFDEAKARAYASRQAETITELLVAKERVKSKVYAVLTPEQREKANTMHERFAARVHEHFHGAGL